MASYAVLKLKQALAERKAQRPDYSLRRFAMYLGVLPPTLSAVLNEKRKLPRQLAPSVARKLKLSPIETDRFLKSLEPIALKSDTSAQSFEAVTLDGPLYRRVIGEWEHFAILSLMETSDFCEDPCWIGKRLGISPARAKTSIQNLEKSGLVRRNSSRNLEKNHINVRTTEDQVSKALQKAHREELQMALRKLPKTPLLFRDYSSVSLAMNVDKIPEAKRLLRRFRQDFAKLVEEVPAQEVFQLSLQFYPLTKIKESAS